MPEIKVEMALDSGFSTPLADRTWTDVSAWLEAGVSINHGRADELTTPTPGTCAVVFDNTDGRFTPRKATLVGGAANPFYPEVKKGKPLRARVRYAADGAGNLLTANQASFETSVADWSVFGSASHAQSAVRAQHGTKSMLITWPTGASGSVFTTATGLVIGRTYVASAYLWVPAGSPACALDVGGFGASASTTTAGAWERVLKTFTATAASHSIGVACPVATTAGQQVWVDAVMLDEGTTVGTFTTDPLPVSVRHTGYVDEYTQTWPDASDSVSHTAVSSSTRRARLGRTAPLKSAIREAYLATGPEAYWPMDDDLTNGSGQRVFRDITNTPIANKQTQSLAAFSDTAALMPTIGDGTTGPTDEGGMVRIPAFSTFALVGTFAHYVGAGGAVNVNSGGYATVEGVARIAPTMAGDTRINVINLFSPSLANLVSVTVADTSTAGFGTAVAGSFLVRDTTGAVLENEGAGDLTLYDTATDGELHHYAFVLDSAGTVGRVYFDGALIGTLSMANAMTDPLTHITFGADSYNANVWVGHGAVHDRALTAAEILAHAEAATAASETPEERVVRIAGRVGVLAAEVVVADTIARDLGSQPEAGRSAAEILDEVAISTGGVLYDTRDGLLAMQARNGRYNAGVAFTLDATAQEVQADLTPVDDHRYTKNTVEYTRSGSTDVPSTLTDTTSIDDNGVFAETYTVVSESDTEVEAFAQDILYRYADPLPRVASVTVDLVNIDAAQRELVLTADIGTLFSLTDLPGQAWVDPMLLFIEGYTENLSATSHTITFNTTPGDLYQNVLILDDPGPRGQYDGVNVWAY